jgi:hypothetical protein
VLETADLHIFWARINTPSVFGELLKPVLATNSVFLKPACSIIARKSFPGIAPPSHWDQLLMICFLSFGSSPIKI